MRWVTGLLAGALALACVSSAQATVWIQSDQGGKIEDYISKYNRVRQLNERVVIDGACLSACTLVLGIVPRGKICITERATLGFHAAWEPDDQGRAVESRKWTRVVWQHLPNPVRRWIAQHGGLHTQMIYLRGDALARLYPSCNERAASL
jgi:hypothetical protein